MEELSKTSLGERLVVVFEEPWFDDYNDKT
jgi:hypothetical protein